jgi:hypothetical protein
VNDVIKNANVNAQEAGTENDDVKGNVKRRGNEREIGLEKLGTGNVTETRRGGTEIDMK